MFEILLKLLKQLNLYRVSARTHVMHVVIGVENELIINHHIHIGDEKGDEYWKNKCNDVINSRRNTGLTSGEKSVSIAHAVIYRKG